MARPRVFVSSTFYDLRQIRNDVATFISDYGFEEILFEAGHISYGSLEPPASYCYEEVENCDLLLSMIGGRFGTNAPGTEYSISQVELRRALERGKQVYIFVQKNVLTEYETYKFNKETPHLKLFHVDDRRIYEFLDELYSLPQNNPIFGFETAQDIIKILKLQWAGLFHRFLNTQMPVHYLQTKLQVFNRLRELLDIPYQVGFDSLAELSRLLDSFGYSAIEHLPWEEHREWMKYENGTQLVLKVSNQILQSFDQFREDMLVLERCQVESHKR